LIGDEKKDISIFRNSLSTGSLIEAISPTNRPWGNTSPKPEVNSFSPSRKLAVFFINSTPLFSLAPYL